MTPEMLTVLGMTAAILFTLWQMNNSLRLEIRDEFKSVRGEIAGLRTEMQDEFKSVRGEIAGLRTEMQDEFISVRGDIGKLSERMARVEGMIDGLREAIAARAAA